MTAGQRSVVLVGLPQEGERVPRVDPFGDQVVANAEPHDAGNFDLLVFVLRLEAVPNCHLGARIAALLDHIDDRVAAIGECGEEVGKAPAIFDPADTARAQLAEVLVAKAVGDVGRDRIRVVASERPEVLADRRDW